MTFCNDIYGCPEFNCKRMKCHHRVALLDMEYFAFHVGVPKLKEFVLYQVLHRIIRAFGANRAFKE